MAGSTNARTHRPTGGAAVGPHLVSVLEQAAIDAGADIRVNNKVVDILDEHNKVVGVEVETETGKYKIRAKAVIIATGGFGANPDIIISYKPDLAGFGTTNHAGATGDSIEWAKELGVELVDMEQIQTHPTVVPKQNIMITEAVRLPLAQDIFIMFLSGIVYNWIGCVVNSLNASVSNLAGTAISPPSSTSSIFITILRVVSDSLFEIKKVS